MQSTLATRRFARRTGLTLLELVMVLVILTALAALIVPIIDYIRRTSDKATASFVMEQISENIGLYRTTTGSYPSKLDSLMEGDGSADSTTELTTLRIGSKTDVATLTAGELNRVDDMFGTVMQHDTSAAYRNFQGDSGINEIPAGVGGQETYIVVTNADIINSIFPNASTNLTGVFPNMVDVPAGTGIVALGPGADDTATTTADNQTARIIVLGVGPNNSAIGNTMVSAPAYAAVDGRIDYNRFFAMFAVYDNFSVSRRPQYKGALDSTGDFLNQELIEVAENQFDNET